MTGLPDLLRRWRLAARPGVPVRVVGRAALGHAHAVFVIDVAGRRLVVGTGPQATTLLDVLGERSEACDQGPRTLGGA